MDWLVVWRVMPSAVTLLSSHFEYGAHTIGEGANKRVFDEAKTRAPATVVQRLVWEKDVEAYETWMGNGGSIADLGTIDLS